MNMAAFIAMLQNSVREGSRAEIFKTVKARFAATKNHIGDSHTARPAVDALSDSGKSLPLPPADPGRMGWVLMDHPFPPCTTGLDSLQPVLLKDLVMGSHHRGKLVSESDGLLIADAYQVRDIAKHNAFGVYPVEAGDDEKANAGLWIHASYINHSCVANAVRCFVGDMMMVYATRSIKKGEEITHQYIPLDCNEPNGRVNNIKDVWGFQCDCPLCTADSKCPDLIQKDEERARQLKSVLDDDESSDACGIDYIETMERLADELAATYDTEVYSGLPKPALVAIQIKLIQAYTRVDDDMK